MSRISCHCPRPAIAFTLFFLSAVSVLQILVSMPVLHPGLDTSGGRIRTVAGLVTDRRPTHESAPSVGVWPCATRRHNRTDADWAQQIARLLWCTAAPPPSQTVAALSARLANRSLLDSSLAMPVCRDACLAARSLSPLRRDSCRFCRCLSAQAEGEEGAAQGGGDPAEGGGESGAPVAQSHVAEAELPAAVLLGVHSMARRGGGGGGGGAGGGGAGGGGAEDLRRELRRAGSTHLKACALRRHLLLHD